MNKIPPEYRPIVYIVFVFILITIFYFIFSPYQQCKRSMPNHYTDFGITIRCGNLASW